MKMVNLRLYEEKLAKKRLRWIGPKVNNKLFYILQFLYSAKFYIQAHSQDFAKGEGAFFAR